MILIKYTDPYGIHRKVFQDDDVKGVQAYLDKLEHTEGVTITSV